MLPQDQRLGDMPVASGPGVFASELDAAIEDLGPSLRRRFVGELSDGLDALEGPRPSGARLMGAGHEDDERLRDAVMPTEALYEVAMLVTGRWGHLALPPIAERASGQFKPQRRMPVFRQGEGPFVRRPFGERMEELEQLLERRRHEAIEAYRDRARRDPEAFLPTGEQRERSNNWIGSFSMMLRAVRFVRAQLALAPRQRSLLAVPEGGSRLLPFGLRWGVLAGDGNQKLPFVSYSELPMATCPGAGACGVYKKDQQSGAPASGWCYSFKAWRYPSAFLRQFLNTLAATSSRAFDIELASGRQEGALSYEGEVEAGFAQRRREWQQFVKVQVLRECARVVRAAVRRGQLPNLLPKDPAHTGRTVFFRLFVDGDMLSADTVAAWMEAIREMASIEQRDAALGPRGVPGTMAPVQVYGYSKAWGEFVAADRRLGRGFWPENYTLNLSNASLYAGSEVEQEINLLPITRGYFNAIDFKTQLKNLQKIDPHALIMPAHPPIPNVSIQQLQGLLELGAVRSPEDVVRLLADRFEVHIRTSDVRDIPPPTSWSENERRATLDRAQWRKKREDTLRKQAFDLALRAMLEDSKIASKIKEELARDEGFVSVAAARRYLAARPHRAEMRFSFEKIAHQERKLVALLVHLLFQAAEQSASGSCPLVCGNCADVGLTAEQERLVYGSQKRFADLPAITGAVHRCASRVPTLGYVPPEGKRLPSTMSVDARGFARGYRRLPGGRVELSVGYYGADVHIGIH